MNALEAEAGLLGLEEYLCSSEAFAAYKNLTTIGKFVVFLACMTFLSILLRGFIIIYYKAHFLLYVFDDFDFRISSEAITSVIQDLLKVGCDVATC